MSLHCRLLSFGSHSVTKHQRPRSRKGDCGFSGKDLPSARLDNAEFITSGQAKVIVMLALALALCNADRVVMSVAIIPLSAIHGWSKSFAGIVQSSFLWGYLISPIVGGLLVDFFGGKVVLTWGVGLWSAATYLTPWAAKTSLLALLAMRVLLGIAEGVALPSMNNLVSRWFPRTERSKAVGIAMAGFQLGNAIGLVLSPIIISKTGVFGPFLIFGLSGFLWVLLWAFTIPRAPVLQSQISNGQMHYVMNERKLILPSKGDALKNRMFPPFRLLLSKQATWALITANAMHSWGYFVILSWAPVYLNMVYGVDLRQAAWFSALPWAVMAIVGYLAGAWSDLLILKGYSITVTRKIMQSVGFLGPAIALLGLNTAGNFGIASLWLIAAVGLKSFGHSGFLVNMQEIAPEYAGAIHGMSNTAGTFAAIVGTIGAGFFLEEAGSFGRFSVLTSFLYMLSALSWYMFASGERVL